MHIAKYKSQAIGNMLNHYRRSSLGTLKRDNIDETRTCNNYEIGNKTSRDIEVAIKELVQKVEQQNGRKIRKDANLLADLVITLPPNVPESDEKRFFVESAKFIYTKLKANGMSDESAFKVFVHKDEATPHAHIAFTPLWEDKNGKKTFNYKKIVPLQFYKTLHQELTEHLTGVLGYEPALLRESDDVLKSLSKLSQAEFKRTKEEMRAQIGELEQQKEQESFALKELLDEKKVLERRLNDLNQPLPAQNMNEIDKFKNNKQEKELKKELEILKEICRNGELECQKLKNSAKFWERENKELNSCLMNLKSELSDLELVNANVSNWSLNRCEQELMHYEQLLRAM